jgi:hypothetical protein
VPNRGASDLARRNESNIDVNEYVLCDETKMATPIEPSRMLGLDLGSLRGGRFICPDHRHPVAERLDETDMAVGRDRGCLDLDPQHLAGGKSDTESRVPPAAGINGCR